jgi:NitT/TauT family transport system ATP-binding protein
VTSTTTVATPRDDPAPDGPLLLVDQVAIGYQRQGRHVPAVEEATFEVAYGEKVMLLGPSGSGKSTILKAVGGFLRPTSGRVVVGGREAPEPGPDRAFVFQEFDQLFPWRTILGNVSYPLKVTGADRAGARRRAIEHLELMGLHDVLDSYPHQLSGGMKQRVAIARALAIDPLMLLMDEPFGALDAQTRGRLQRELADIVARTRVALLFVTHSSSAAFALILAPAVAIAAGAALPAHAQDAACRDEIARLETAFAQEREGPGPEAERVEIPSPSREQIAQDVARSGGVVAPSTIGSGVSTEQPARGVEPAPMNRNAGQQPGARAGATLSPEQRERLKTLLQEGRSAADRGDTETCRNRVREARQLARGSGPGVGSPPGGG